MKPLDLDLTQAQLFIDDRLVADQARLMRRLHQARKHPEPVLRPDRPWEGSTPVMYGTVLRREGRFQMWYCTSGPARVVQVCYAESDDGLTWRKPSLGIIEYEGSKDNNICLAPSSNYIDDISVIDDPDGAAWPLKALFWEPLPAGASGIRGGIRAARSRDGIHWDALPGFVLPEWHDRFNAISHREGGKFVVLGREPDHQARYGQDRTVSRTESDDLVHWSKPQVIHRPALHDPPNMRIYSATAFRYEGRLLGFLERMFMRPDLLDCELTHSADGRRWERIRERAPFIERGPENTWDGNWLNLNSGPPILHHGRLWFYYSGRSCCHATPYPGLGAIGMATLRRDGFASLDALEEPGFVQTPRFVWRGRDLLVNVDTRREESAHPNFPAGEVRVEVRGRGDRPVKGFGLDDCVPIRHNSERNGKDGYLPLRWRGDRSLGALDGQPLSLRFVFRDASLYAFKAGMKEDINA